VGLICVVGSRDAKDFGDLAMAVVEAYDHSQRGGNAVLMVCPAMQRAVQGDGGGTRFPLFVGGLPLWQGGVDVRTVFENMVQGRVDRVRVVDKVSAGDVDAAVDEMLGGSEVKRVRVRVLNHGDRNGPCLPTGERIEAGTVVWWVRIARREHCMLMVDCDACDSGEWQQSVVERLVKAGLERWVVLVSSTVGIGYAWAGKFVLGTRYGRPAYGATTSVSARARALHLQFFSGREETLAQMSSAISVGARAGAVMRVDFPGEERVASWLPQGVMGEALLEWPLLCVDDFIVTIGPGEDELVEVCGVDVRGEADVHVIVPEGVVGWWSTVEGGAGRGSRTELSARSSLALRAALRLLPGEIVGQAIADAAAPEEARSLYAWACGAFACGGRSAWPSFRRVAAYVGGGVNASDRAERALKVERLLLGIGQGAGA
jgi:hypothetical protein